jgi:TIGR03009 family protein
VFGKPDEPRYVELGEIKYATPDRALFRVDTAEKDGKGYPIEDARAEHWVFDGKSIIEYNHKTKRVIEHKLPPDFHGSRILDGPLTFPPAGLVLSSLFGVPASPYPYPFGAKAEELKKQFYLRESTPADQHDQIWLEAYPRSSAVAANCQKLQLIFRASDMSPFAMKIVQPNGKDHIVYQFYNIVVNSPSTLPADDPFHPAVPIGWRKIVEEPPAVR